MGKEQEKMVLFGNRVFANIVKMMSGWVSPDPMTSVLTMRKQSHGDTRDTWWEDGHVKQREKLE